MRNSIVSGIFYDSSPERLKNQLKSCFLSDFGPGALPEKGRNNLKGVIAPHAGYSYSGPCAAYSYKAIAEAETPDLFIILGLSHSGHKSCLSLEDWKTPLGLAKNDQDFAKALMKNGILQDESAHAEEHSIEVQLPFLQFICKEFKFVPVIVSENYKDIAAIIKKTMEQTKKRAIIIASSDFTHYGKNYGYMPFTENIKERMYKLDDDAIKQIKKLDAKSFLDYVNKTGATICGKYAIAAFIELVNPAKAELLKYYTSADITKEDYATAVGYAALKF